MYYFYDKINQRHIVSCMEAVHISESPLSKVPLYTQYRDYANTSNWFECILYMYVLQ